MLERYVIGIDMGTSSMKLMVVDNELRVLARDSVDYHVTRSEDGWSEISPDAWYDGMINGLKRVLSQVDRSKISAIGVTGQMHSLVIIDENGKAIRPAILWDDMRTATLLPRLRTHMEQASVSDYNVNTLSTGSPAAGLFWLKEHEEENFERIKKFLIGPDYLVYRLTGNYGTDYCEASTSCMFDINSKSWSEQMMNVLGLRPEVFPTIRGSACPAGSILSSLAEQLLLRKDVQVITGTGDNAAAALALGCLHAGKTAISLGTSGVIMYGTEELSKIKKGKIIVFSPDGKNFMYIVQGVVQSTGNAVDWWVKEILGNPDLSKIDSMLQLSKPQNKQLLFYPHLAGDKTLHSDPLIRGAFIGLCTQTTACDMIRAVLEGISFAFRELSDGMGISITPSSEISVVGGGTRSVAWLQTLADTLGTNIVSMHNDVSPALGIAQLALSTHVGGSSGASSYAGGHIKSRGTYRPNLRRYTELDKKFKKYLRLYHALKEIEG